MMYSTDARSIGQAGEFLAASVLQRHFKAIVLPQTPEPYDLIVEDDDGNFYKCQVKTAGVIDTINNCEYYRFNAVKRQSQKQYTASDADFFAFVALPDRLVWFVDQNSAKATNRIRVADLTEATEAGSLIKTMETIRNV